MEPRELLKSDRSVQSQVDIVLERARWAAGAFAGYDRARTLAIAKAVAEAGAARAISLSEPSCWSVSTTS